MSGASIALADLHRETILERIAKGDPLTIIAQDAGYADHSGIINRMGDDPAYQKALSAGAVAKLEKREKELEVAAVNVTVTRADRLLNHARWWASKMNPDQFGDKQQIDLRAVSIQVVQYVAQTPNDAVLPPVSELPTAERTED